MPPPFFDHPILPLLATDPPQALGQVSGILIWVLIDFGPFRTVVLQYFRSDGVHVSAS